MFIITNCDNSSNLYSTMNIFPVRITQITYYTDRRLVGTFLKK